MKTLITGGTGALGLELARLLCAQGDTVTLFDTAPRQLLAAALVPNAAIVRGNATNWPELLAALRVYSPDRIFHLGALPPSTCELNLAAAFNVNVQGTFNLLEAARLAGTPMVIYAGSMAVFGTPGETVDDDAPRRPSTASGTVTDDDAPRHPTTAYGAVTGDDVPRRPTTVYGATTLCAETLARAYHGRDGVDVRGVRLPPIVGLPVHPPGTLTVPDTVRRTTEVADLVDAEGDGGSIGAGIASAMLHATVAQRLYVAPAPPDTPLIAIYRRDAARALALLAAAPAANLHRRIYNVAGLTPLSLADLAAALRAEAPGTETTFAPKTATAARFSERWPIPDDANAREDWGWQPLFMPGTMARDAADELAARPLLYRPVHSTTGFKNDEDQDSVKGSREDE